MKFKKTVKEKNIVFETLDKSLAIPPFYKFMGVFILEVMPSFRIFIES